MYLCRFLINLLHRLGIRKPYLPVPRRRLRALPLRAVPRHRLAMGAHAGTLTGACVLLRRRSRRSRSAL